jgi:hypothetical protein
MTAIAASTPAAERSGSPPGALLVGIAAFALVELALAVFMAAAPHAFYTAIGPFGAFNGHYERDVATFEGAIAIMLLISLRRPSWRVPALALTTIQFALHSINHLIDINRAHPAWLGYFDFLSLAAATVMLAWLWREASRQAVAHAAPSESGSGRTPTAQRSIT